MTAHAVTPAAAPPESHPEHALTATQFALSPVFFDKIHALHQQLAAHFDLASPAGFAAFLQQSQGISEHDALAIASARPSPKDSLSALNSFVASDLASVLVADPDNDLTHPLSHYFVSTSHNTYLTGNQLYSESSVEEYKNVLLRGGRCVEIDVWDGNPNGPRDDDEKKPSDDARGLRQRLGLKASLPKSASAAASVASTSDSSSSAVSLKRNLSQRIKTKLGLRPKVLTQDKEPAPLESVKEPEQLAPPSPWRADSSPIREPRVLHGHTLTKEVPFRKVCTAIRDAAFVTSDLPVVVSLEVHCSHQQQEQMVSIIKSIWGPHLALLPISAYANPDGLALPSPSDLKRRILIKVKYTPPEKAAAKAKRDDAKSVAKSGAPQTEPDSDDDASSTPEDSEDSKEKKKKKPKMIKALSELGIYTRAYHYKSFSEPEASIPTHVFSLSEGTLFTLSANNPGPLFHHNAHYLMRCYPKGTRIRSSNLTPTPFWRSGVQMVALNWQNLDKANMLNEGMFAGSGGWVLKPATHRPTGVGKKHGWYHFGKAAAVHAQAKDESATTAEVRQTSSPAVRPELPTNGSTEPAESWTAKYLTLSITLLAAQNLPLPSASASEASFRPYFKMSLHTEGLTPAVSFADLAQVKSVESTTSASTRRDSLHPHVADGEPRPSPPATRTSFSRHGSISRHNSIHRSGSTRGRRRSTSSVQRSGQAASIKMKHRSPTIHPHLLSSHSAPCLPTSPDLQNYVVNFEDVEIDDERLCLLRIKIMDDLEMRRDELAAWACLRLDRIGEGLRVISLRDRNGKESDGRVLVKVVKTVREVEVGGGGGGAK